MGTLSRSTTTRTLRRRLLVPVAMMSFALVAAGCNDDGSASEGAASPAAHAGTTGPARTSPQPSDSASAPRATTPASPAAPSGSGASSGAGASAPGRCAAEGLGMSVKRGDGGAGQVYYELTFVNKSGHPCALNGFPGVSLIQRDGAVIGAPAERDGASHGAAVLAPGGTAHVVLHTLNQGIADGGCWKQGDYLRVYPPGSKEALTLRDPQIRVCGDRFTTTSVER